MKTIRLLLACSALSTLNLQLSTAFAQGNAFTYQGVLSQNGTAVNGSNDLTFTLYNASSGGATVGTSNTVNDLVMSNGLFAVTLNFGVGAFDGNSRWLQIAARPGASTGAYTNLAPRQPVTPSPYAIYAGSANASNLVGTVQPANLSGVAFLGSANTFSSGNQIITGGNLGIGVNNPVDLLDVALGGIIGNSTTFVNEHNPGNQGPKVGFGYRDPFSGDFNGMRSVVNPGPSCGNSGDLLFYTWACNSSVSREVMRINGLGNVGLGTTNPIAGLNAQDSPVPTLDVNGVIAIDGNNNLEFGAGIPGKEISAGKIGYERFTPDSLDIVGAGTNVSARKIMFFAEGGATFAGNILANNFIGIGTTTPRHKLDVNGNIFLGTQRNGQIFNEIGDTLYLGAEQKYLGNTLGTPVNGSTDWINLMANSLSSGIIFGLSTSTANPHSNNIPLMVIKSNGNVGIGIGATNPATALQVNGTVTATSFAGSFAGNGSGLTNVALLSGGNALTGQQTVMSGNVGIGTTAPTGPLTVATTHGTLTVANGQFVPELIANGGSSSGHLRFRNALEVWPDTNNINPGYLDVRGTNTNPSIILDGSNGEITCTALNITSDRNAKEEFKPVNAREVLAKVVGLPITEWRYKTQADARHIGPMAQDFREAFTLGHDEKHIATVDESGVALAAIQGLNEKLEEKTQEVDALKKSVVALTELVNKLAARQNGGAR